MSKIDNGVPWAEGRRALVHHNTFDGHGPRWVSAVGITRSVFAHNAKWPSCALWALVGRPDDFEWASDAVTILEPGQCRECYEIDAHTETCARGKRIADNRARGVPAFWAEWAMDEAPPPRYDVRLLALYMGSPFRVLFPFDGVSDQRGGWSAPVDGSVPVYEGQRVIGWSFVAVGYDGFTLAPWGL